MEDVFGRNILLSTHTLGSMASPVYTVLLGRTQQSSSAVVPLFTAPDDDSTTVVRDIVLYNADLLEQLLTVRINRAVGNIVLVGATVPNNTSAHFELRQVLARGDLVEVVGQGAFWTATVTGYHFRF